MLCHFQSGLTSPAWLETEAAHAVIIRTRQPLSRGVYLNGTDGPLQESRILWTVTGLIACTSHSLQALEEQIMSEHTIELTNPASLPHVTTFYARTYNDSKHSRNVAFFAAELPDQTRQHDKH